MRFFVCFFLVVFSGPSYWDMVGLTLFSNLLITYLYVSLNVWTFFFEFAYEYVDFGDIFLQCQLQIYDISLYIRLLFIESFRIFLYCICQISIFVHFTLTACKIRFWHKCYAASIMHYEFAGILYIPYVESISTNSYWWSSSTSLVDTKSTYSFQLLVLYCSNNTAGLL